MSEQPQNNPILIIVRGIPGSGKSYFADELSVSIGREQTVVLDPDAIDKASPTYKDFIALLQSEGVDQRLYPYRYLRDRAHQAIQAKKTIIWNQPFTSFDGLTKTIHRLEEYASEKGLHLKVLIVEVELDADTAKERVNERKNQGGHGPSDATFARFSNEYESFSGQGYETIAVCGGLSFDGPVKTVKTMLSRD